MRQGFPHQVQTDDLSQGRYLFQNGLKFSRIH